VNSHVNQQAKQKTKWCRHNIPNSTVYENNVIQIYSWVKDIETNTTRNQSYFKHNYINKEKKECMK